MRGMCLHLTILLLIPMFGYSQEKASQRTETLSVARTVGEDSTVDVLRKQFDSNDSDTRVAALRGLAKVADERAMSILISALDDNSERIRWTAAEVLGDLGKEEAIPAFILALTRSDVGVRARAAFALGKLRARSALETLIHAMDDPSELVRRRAADALDALGWTAQTEDESIAYLVARQNWKRLIEIGGPSTGRLVRVLVGADFEQAKSAAKALASLGWKAHDVGEHVAYLMAAEDDAEIRKIGTDGIAPLLQLLENRGYWGREAAARILGETGTVSVTPSLVRALNEDFFVRRAAARALEVLGWKPETEEERVAFLIGKSDWQKLATVGAPAVPPLVRLMMEENPLNVKEAKAAAVTLGHTRDNSAIDPLIRALENKSGLCRWEAATALGEVGSEKAIVPLSKAMYGGEDNLREAAAAALVEIGGSAVEPLLKALDCESPAVRAVAAKVLGHVDAEVVAERLARTLREDGDASVRRAAAWALGAMQDKQAVQPLLESLRDNNEEVREAATLALQRIDPAAYAHWRRGRAFQVYAVIVMCVVVVVGVMVFGLVMRARRRRGKPAD